MTHITGSAADRKPLILFCGVFSVFARQHPWSPMMHMEFIDICLFICTLFFPSEEKDPKVFPYLPFLSINPDHAAASRALINLTTWPVSPLSLVLTARYFAGVGTEAAAWKFPA